MSFLDKIWQKLAEKQKNQPVKQIQFKNVYQGYRTIPIQNLERLYPQSPDSFHSGLQWIWKQEGQEKKIYTYLQNEKYTSYAGNGFFQAFYKAYMNHGDIKIKPDQVWMIIMFWFTKYVNDNAQQLRHAFVAHEGKKSLTVITDRDENNWIPFLTKMVEEIKKNTINGVVEELECNFTTTGLFQRAFSTALIMNTCKRYFDYGRGKGGCGVVNIHMGGTLEDWEKLQKKLANLQRFDVNGNLKKYVRGLKPILHQFTQTFKGNAHLQFWNNIYFERQDPQRVEYVPLKIINGWLIKFLTFQDQLTKLQSLQTFSIDIKCVDTMTKKETHFNLVGGCRGISRIDSYVFTPHYSFIVVEDAKKMKKAKEQARMSEALNKYKERLMKKKQQSLPLNIKKTLQVEYKKPSILNSPYLMKDQFKKDDKSKKKQFTAKSPMLPSINKNAKDQKQKYEGLISNKLSLKK